MWQGLSSSTPSIYRRNAILHLPHLHRRTARCRREMVMCDRRKMDSAEHLHISDSVASELPVPDEDEDTKAACQWPLPLSPLSGEPAKAVELERALRAEALMASGPAFAAEDIIYQDQWLIVINKPSGVYSGHVLSTVTAMNSSPENDPSLKLEGTMESKISLHLANRLDRDTSGVMIVTKCKVVAGKLTRMFQSRKAKKTYVALCVGPRPTWNEIHLETGHGRSRWGAWRVYAQEDVGRKLPENAVVKDMSTCFSVLAVNGKRVSGCCCDDSVCESRVALRNQPYENVPAFGDEVLLRAYPSTGRTHQIRLHCQFLGLPLRGDVKYGGPLVWKGNTYGTHALHAESMSFRHPITDVSLTFVAPLPEWALC